MSTNGREHKPVCWYLLLTLAVRSLRVPEVYQTTGGVRFAAVGFAAWILGTWVIRMGTDERQRLARAGRPLLTPFALVSLFWVSIGTPWEATPA